MAAAAASVCSLQYVFKRKADGRPAAVAAVAAGIIAAPSADKAAGAEKWKAESSLLRLSSMSEKFESPIGWDHS